MDRQENGDQRVDLFIYFPQVLNLHRLVHFGDVCVCARGIINFDISTLSNVYANMDRAVQCQKVW